MKDEGIELKKGHIVWLEKVLKGSWLFENGYGDEEYIRLSHIITEERYFEWDKRFLNELRTIWLSNPIMGLPF